MDILSFDISVLGASFVMLIDFIKITFKNDYILFSCHMKNEPIMTTLYRTRKHHDDIIRHLEDTPNSPIMVKKINKYRHHVSFDKNYENLQHLISMMELLFPDEDISFEVLMFNNDNYLFGKCSYHLLDLYEMGYMSLVPVDLHGKHQKLFAKYNPKVFTGLYLIARNAFNKYHYDFVEMNFFNNVRQDFFKLSFNMLIQDCPEMTNKLTKLVYQLVATIPLKEDTNIHSRINYDWKNYNDLEIKLTDLQVPLKEWENVSFLKCVSKLLDMFPNYYINPKFNIDMTF